MELTLASLKEGDLFMFTPASSGSSVFGGYVYLILTVPTQEIIMAMPVGLIGKSGMIKNGVSMHALDPTNFKEYREYAVIKIDAEYFIDDQSVGRTWEESWKIY